MTKAKKGWFLSASEENLKTVDSIRRLKARYPSFKVVGRGTLVISPKEIAATPEHQQIVSKAKRFANG